jgi:hypothetical protein
MPRAPRHDVFGFVFLCLVFVPARRSDPAIRSSCHSAIQLGTVEQPKYRPLERFWPYANLSEQPTAEELAALDPELHDALFGARQRPFSITIVFPPLDLARNSAEFRETGSGPSRRYRARFWTRDASQLRDLFAIVGPSHDTEVLIDDRPMPYARELWLPLLYFLIYQ